MIISNILRLVRKCLRIPSDMYSSMKFRLSLLLNNVHHKSIKSYGVPYIAVSPKGTCIIGENFRMSNGVRFNPIGFPQPCQIVVTDGARLEIMTKPEMQDQEKTMARTGFIHLAISVGSKEKVDSITATLKKDGYEVASGPRTTGDGYYESCVIGIEGNQIEITI